MKSLYIVCAAALALSATSCSVYENIMGKKEKPTTVSGASATDVTAAKKTEKGGEAPAKEAATPPVLVHPSLTPKPAETPAAEATPATPAAPAAPVKKAELTETERLLGGEWTIVQVGTTVIDRDENMPYIVFVPGDHTFYANNGCNTLNGGYAVEGDRISFINVLSTMRLCPDTTFDHEINAVMAEDTYINIEEVGSETILELRTSSAKPLMRMRRGNLEFLNGQWAITAVNGVGELKDNPTVFFDLTDLKMHGNTGCNFINGELYLDHREPNAIDISQIITTLRMCEYPSQQTAILVALEETASVISDGADKAILLSRGGKILMHLSRAKS